MQLARGRMRIAGGQLVPLLRNSDELRESLDAARVAIGVASLKLRIGECVIPRRDPDAVGGG